MTQRHSAPTAAAGNEKWLQLKHQLWLRLSASAVTGSVSTHATHEERQQLGVGSYKVYVFEPDLGQLAVPRRRMQVTLCRVVGVCRSIHDVSMSDPVCERAHGVSYVQAQ